MSGLIGSLGSKSGVISGPVLGNIISRSDGVAGPAGTGYFATANKNGVHYYEFDLSTNTYLDIFDLTNFGSGHYIFCAAKHGDSNSFRGMWAAQVNEPNNYNSMTQIHSMNFTGNFSSGNFQLKLPSHSGTCRMYVLRIGSGLN